MKPAIETTAAGEVWKDIEGYEGIYQVSNFGRVRSLDRQATYTSRCGTIAYRPTKGKVLTAQKIHGGYLGVLFKVQGHAEMKLVHRLVAKAFVPNPQNLETVNHIDEDKINNCAWNLEWMSRGDNVRYGTGSQRKRTPTRAVVQKSADGQDIRTWPTAKEAGQTLGICPSHITACCRGKRGVKTAGGYRWRYAE